MTKNNTISFTTQAQINKIDIEKNLDLIVQYLNKHAILPQGASEAIALWCLASYDINLFRIYPKLTIYSPEKRCGKSTVLDLIEAFAYKTLVTSNMSPASIYRVINKQQPTLIMDEADTYVQGGSSELTGIINSGHSKSKAFVTRCKPKSLDVERFSTWTPMVLASIGKLPPTIMDRSVVIKLRRKTMQEIVERIPQDIGDQTKNIKVDLEQWIKVNSNSIKNNTIEPEYLGNDRAVDNWLPLFAIANQVSDRWLKKCEWAYKTLTVVEQEQDLSTSLLEDIREIFIKTSISKFPSAQLVEKLIEDKDKQWCECNKGRVLTQNTLAKMLKTYDIKPKTIRHAGSTLRGYEIGQFRASFDSYLQPLP